LETLEIFTAAAEAQSFVKAARKLARSPAQVTRAIAQLEGRLGVRLFNRNTRAVSLSVAGGRYLDQAKRALAEFAALELTAAGEQATARGLLTVTAPEMFGRLHVLPIAQDFMRANAEVSVSLVLLNRLASYVSFVEEGIDLGIRIANLGDSTLRAIKVGSVTRVCCASPDYIAARGAPKDFDALAEHDTIVVTGVRPNPDRWSFLAGPRVMTVNVAPRLTVNAIQPALDAAVRGGGIVRLLSYQTAELEAAGKLVRLLTHAPQPPLPIQIVHPAGRYLPPKVRAFIDHAVPELRRKFAA
jgi:DNA-binding transcriptional LysR family regulator